MNASVVTSLKSEIEQALTESEVAHFEFGSWSTRYGISKEDLPEIFDALRSQERPIFLKQHFTVCRTGDPMQILAAYHSH